MAICVSYYYKKKKKLKKVWNMVGVQVWIFFFVCALTRLWQHFSKMGSQKKEAILQAKWAVNFVQKAKWAKNELWVSGLHYSSHFLLVQPSHAAAERIFSILQFSSSHLWRITWNSLLCCNTPCSLDSLICACTLIIVCKKWIFGKQNGWIGKAK